MANFIYLDYAASTPVDKAVLKKMLPFFSVDFGNPGSLHQFGRTALSAVDQARIFIAQSFHARPGRGFRELIFTGSATEANNLALRGAVKAFRGFYPDRTPKIIISAIEHESIIQTANDLAGEGAAVTVLSVDRQGLIDLAELEKELDGDTAIVSVMFANNEIGVVEPLEKIGELVADFKKNRPAGGQSDLFPIFHSDAVQAFQFIDCRPSDCGVDLMTISAQKIYGPKGIGALYIRRAESELSRLAKIKPIITGGRQEFGLRAGTENVPAIVGFSEAVKLVLENRPVVGKSMLALADYFFKELKKTYPALQLNGPPMAARRRSVSRQFSPDLNQRALPNILNVSFPGFRADDLLIKLDLSGVGVSTGSACTARSAQKSHVLTALDLDGKRLNSSLRFSFGRPTTKEELKQALSIIKKILKAKQLRS